MSDSHPAETLVTVTFADHERGTTVTLRHTLPESAEERKGTEQGWGEIFDRLARHLSVS